MHNILRFTAALAAFAGSAVACGSNLSVSECFEGSDFIANAALARENGMSREGFLAQMQDDFVLIQVYPPQLRWFAKDGDDERFLYESAEQVFDSPQDPEQHRAQFLAACFARAPVGPTV
ncbi:MAG TPA: hypothetical protein VMN56_20290 [Casimicrobiaceae bacterium]|nr:hypothetical protein [Casimicrobiaceae bacterium]